MARASPFNAKRERPQGKETLPKYINLLAVKRKRSLVRARYDVHPPAFAVELDHAVNQGEQRKILAFADVAAGVERRADLPNENVAGANFLAAESLDATPLGVRVPSVAA